jgi:hypothetical protein
MYGYRMGVSLRICEYWTDCYDHVWSDWGGHWAFTAWVRLPRGAVWRRWSKWEGICLLAWAQRFARPCSLFIWVSREWGVSWCLTLRKRPWNLYGRALRCLYSQAICQDVPSCRLWATRGHYRDDLLGHWVCHPTCACWHFPSLGLDRNRSRHQFSACSMLPHFLPVSRDNDGCCFRL